MTRVGPGTTLDRARELHASAAAANQAGQPLAARRAARLALRQLGRSAPGLDRDHLLGRVQLTLAVSEAELAGPAAGLPLLAAVTALAEQVGDWETLVLARSQRGVLALRAGDLALAAEEYRWARELLAHAPRPDQVVILANTANVHLFRRELGPARTHFRDAIAIAAKEGLVRQEAMWRHNLGYVEFLAGKTHLTPQKDLTILSPDGRMETI